ncbi:Iron binding protein SufA for iron-sulfur cluster assembly [Salmonella enterica subsp. enterica]|uniref:Iron binding protein SufA for iron-sulfur cluster assembly n=1 Tax=Salmonella enterica I TaxID=59201 RepID=A0A447PDJ7_SALET|nr:Iron binding protein SufA for iron-sulfur cluster assembly [Salmonella enterica subsp. enterica]
MFWIPFGSRIKTIWFLKPKAQSFSHRYRRCLLFDGTEVDYVQEGLNQLFKFHNPKAQNECGCGESFGV